MFSGFTASIVEIRSSTAPSEGTEGEVEALIETEKQLPAKVLLFNDEVHTFEEVTSQIIKATGCDSTTAEALTWEVHSTGKAVVYQGEMVRCMQVSAVLEEIELMTQIEV